MVMSNQNNEIYDIIQREIYKILHRKEIACSYGEILVEEYEKYEEICLEILAEFYEED